MDTLVSTWSRGIQSLPENYILPLESRPGSDPIPFCNTIPLIHLNQSSSSQQRQLLIHQIFKACQEFGFFQVVDDEISEELMNSTMSVFKAFFAMDAKDKESFCTDKPNRDFKSCTLYTSSVNYATEDIHFWRDNLRHLCHPVQDFIQYWPQNPSQYREVVGTYSVETRKLGLRILELMSEGLGLGSGHFGDELTNSVLLSINHYPPCPDPSLALGLPKHCDPNLITILLQDDVYGLQVFKDGEWIGVEPLPNAFVVNIGYQLEIISNGKLKSAQHRVVTNSSVARTTCAMFINPSHESLVEPAKSLISAESAQLYRPFQYKEFLMNYTTYIGNEEMILAPFKIQP